MGFFTAAYGKQETNYWSFSDCACLTDHQQGLFEQSDELFFDLVHGIQEQLYIGFK